MRGLWGVQDERKQNLRDLGGRPEREEQASLASEMCPVVFWYLNQYF